MIVEKNENTFEVKFQYEIDHLIFLDFPLQRKKEFL
jgi:hypothetical protein